MKKHISIIAVLILLLSLTVPAFAGEGDAQAELNYISDNSGLLTSEEKTELISEAEAVSSRYGCSVYAVIVDDYTDYTGDSILDFAQAVYNEYNLGWGEERDGIILVLSMEERDFALCAHGSTGNSAFTDYGKYVLEDEFLDDFRENDWEGGFEDYIETCGEFLELNAQGTPVDTSPGEYDGRYDNRYGESIHSEINPNLVILIKLAVTVLVPLLIALIVCLALKSRMRSVHYAARADEYVDRDSVRFTERSDSYVTTTYVVIPKIENNSSGLGGGGTSINSGGFSGHSGKF